MSKSKNRQIPINTFVALNALERLYPSDLGEPPADPEALAEAALALVREHRAFLLERARS